MLCAEDRIDTAFFPYGPGSPDAMIHNDHLGTPHKMTDASGTIVWASDYKPFGEATVTVSTITNSLRLPGQYYDVETGLHYNYFRDYNPAIGQYVQADPIGIKEGKNHLYVYVARNPVKNIDPTGLAHCTLVFLSIGIGQLSCIPDHLVLLPVVIPVASGNNGGGSGCKNNPSCDDQPNRGPIPAGDWVWTNGYTSKPNGRVLEPLPGTNTKKRINIRSHSCSNAFGPSLEEPFCSEGCVTGQAADIQRLNDLLDAEPGSTLHVGP